MTSFKTWLPVPPTSNNLYATNFKTKKRYPAEAYVKWQKLAERNFISIPEPMTGRIKATYSYIFTDARRRDIENFAKAVSDFLVNQKVLGDDSQIDHMELIRSSGTIPGVFITLERIP